MYSSKQYTDNALVLVTAAMTNVPQRYSDVYSLLENYSEEEIAELAVRFLSSLIAFICAHFISQAVLRSCFDPFWVQLNSKVLELEAEISENEVSYADLYQEKCELDEKIAELTGKLNAAEKALIDIKAQYACCRYAAQTFLESTTPEHDTQG